MLMHLLKLVTSVKTANRHRIGAEIAMTWFRDTV